MASAVQTGQVRMGDLGIAYESVGTGEPALLLIHGVFQDRSYFLGQQTHFSGRRQVVTLDLRGHGDSSATPEVTIEDFAADVIAVAEGAGIESVVLCGHSMGGAVALEVASARPDLVRGVAMLDAVVLFPEPVRQAGLAHLVPALATEDWLEALHGFFRTQILDPGDPADLTARVTADLGRARPEFARTFFASLFASDYAEDLQNAPCPLLYIHGKVPADLKRLAELRPDALVGQAVGGGHYLMQTVPGQVNAMLDRFLEVVEGRLT
jgi:pimeloyl-ACP methyl ester carboxylesterase